MVSLAVSVINIVLRTINMVLISFIGYHTESNQTKAIMTSIFISSFFNTAILLLITNSNTQQSHLAWLGLSGQFPDMTYEWYFTIAPALVQTMLINAVFPIVEIGYSYPLRVFWRLLDRGFCSCDTTKTKKKSIQQYVNVYSGPNYLMHFKYSSLLNNIFVTFMYGLAIPILFPICLFAIIILYMVERFQITYVYKKPPMYDEKLNNAALSILKWAPFALFLFGFWLMGNKQIFSNVANPVELKTDPITTDHYYVDMEICQALPLLILAMVYFFFAFFNDSILKFLVFIKASKEEQEQEVDEKLGTYFACLTPF